MKIVSEYKTKLKKWVKDHKELLIFGTVGTIAGIGGTVAMFKYIDSIPVTVDDVTEITKLPLPDLKNEITMYDDRLDCWIPVIRKLTEEEFKTIYEELEQNPDKTLVNCLTERELIPDYLYG